MERHNYVWPPRIPTVREELTEAATALGLGEPQFRVLSDDEGTPIISDIETHFVQWKGLTWWWEAFRDAPTASHDFRDVAGYCWGATHLTRIVPPDSGIIWLIVEASPRFVLCVGTVDAIQSVIWESGVGEYYLVPKGLDWLVCENHHGVVIAVGEAVMGRLRKVAPP